MLILSADAVTSAVKLIKHVYDDDKDPKGAWQWWLSPCGGTDLVLGDLKRPLTLSGR